MPDLSLLYLPLILFVGMGLVDSLVKLAQFEYVSDNNLSLFTAITIRDLCPLRDTDQPYRQEKVLCLSSISRFYSGEFYWDW